MKHDLASVTKAFETIGKFVRGGPYGNGHIHDTFAVTCEHKGIRRRYLLQKINTQIFVDPDRLMQNIDRVTRHIRGQLERDHSADLDRRVLSLIRTKDGELLHRDSKGHVWRMYVFIENALTYDTVKNLAHAFEAARAFGEFERSLLNLPRPPLHETIPDFLNGQRRFEAFQKVLTADTCGRAKRSRAEIDFANQHAGLFETFQKLIERREIPLRIMHNDTKINNVMFDPKTGRALCVIDLDTVMAGVSMYDFGDLVRTIGSNAAEDEKDLSKISLEIPRFEALVKGYLTATSSFLTPVERQHLVLGSEIITFMVGVRFLTDHLNGDRYFKIHRKNHNLDRCRAQFKLLRSILENEENLVSLVNRISRTV